MKSNIKLKDFGATGLKVPPVIFGTSCLGNLYQALDYKTKLEIASGWFKYLESPIVLDSAGKYGAGLALEMIGKTLNDLDVDPNDVIISNKLAWKRIPLKGDEPTFEPGAWIGIENDAEQDISHDGILECFKQGNELLGGKYSTEIVSIHDPDEFIGQAKDSADYNRRFSLVLDAYKVLFELKKQGKVKAVGVGSKDWRVIRELLSYVDLDWVMFACSLTAYTHPKELLNFMSQLKEKNVAMINSAVFNGGFLTGGEFFDYRKPNLDKDAELFWWRDKFFAICKKYNAKPATVCVHFGLSVPGVVAVALNTSKPNRVKDCVESVTAHVREGLWSEMKEQGLISKSYPYLG